MVPWNRIKEIVNLCNKELERGTPSSASWHAAYKNSAYVFAGGLPYKLNEGDIIQVFSQVGEIVDCNLLRDKKTGKSKGSCFIAYEDQRSTVLAVDNFNGSKILDRTIYCDHVKQYRIPDDENRERREEDGVVEDDETYLERRKKVWDYEKYEQAIEPFDAEETKAALKRQEEEKERAERLEEQLKARKDRRALAIEEEKAWAEQMDMWEKEREAEKVMRREQIMADPDDGGRLKNNLFKGGLKKLAKEERKKRKGVKKKKKKKKRRRGGNSDEEEGKEKKREFHGLAKVRMLQKKMDNSAFYGPK